MQSRFLKWVGGRAATSVLRFAAMKDECGSQSSLSCTPFATLLLPTRCTLVYPPHPEEAAQQPSRRMGGHSLAAVRAGQGGLARTAASYMRNVGASPVVRRIHVFSTEHGCARRQARRRIGRGPARVPPQRQRIKDGGNGRARARTAAQGASPGRGELRSVHARALRHRRVALSDHADRRGRAALDERGRARARARARGGRERAAARRRHLAVRPDA